MSVGLQQLRIRTRIFAGFGTLIAIAVSVAVLGDAQLGAIGTQVETMQSAEENSALAREAAMQLELLRRATSRYDVDASPEALAWIRAAQSEAAALLQKAAATTASAEQRQTYAEIQRELDGVGPLVERMVVLQTGIGEQTANVRQSRNTLSVATGRLTEAVAAGPVAVNAAAAAVEKATMLVRIANWRYLATRDPTDRETIRVVRLQSDRAIEQFAQLADDAGRSTIPQLQAALDGYTGTIDRLDAASSASARLKLDEMVPALTLMQQQLAAARATLATAAASSKRGSDNTIAGAIWLQTIVTGAAALVGITLAFFIGRSIVAPLNRMTSAMRRLAQGDVSVDVPDRDGTDEISDIGRAVEVFKANMMLAADASAEQAREQARKAARQQMIDATITSFDHSVRELLNMLAAAATEMRGSAEAMSDTANQTNQQAGMVAAAAELASANVQTMAAATEEMAASASEITRQVARSTQIAARAVEAARSTDRQVQGLADAAQTIEAVVAIINGIAGQTNLLALNATIEAARAGDAGKGFAVVASEVKALAGQTGRATDQIGAQIQAIQAATREAVDAIKAIGGTINEINDISTTIAAAMEEQGATTAEMTRNTQQASQGTQNVSSTIGDVSQGASATGAAASHVVSAASELGQKAEILRAEVGGFLDKIRAA